DRRKHEGPFAPAALYSSSLFLPLAVSDSPSRPWQSRWAAVRLQGIGRALSSFPPSLGTSYFPPEHPFSGLASDVIVLGAGERNCMADNTYDTTLTPDAIAAITQPSCPPVGG
ncbi:MAG: hypothetical protein P8R45_07900, partial [Candidatus Binatia bacterium]|nr:hypothetical protein [Candidatus Binatia bacterium]